MDKQNKFVTKLIGAQMYQDDDNICHLFIIQEYIATDLRKMLDN
tara:strand:+ start:284 stop:415 length:132 start_codon:yes stop_codon:yes gene_type:complete